MNESEKQPVIANAKLSRRAAYIWLGLLVSGILLCDGLFFWGLIDLGGHYDGELTIMRGHEICEMHMVQAIFNALLWLGAFAAVLLATSVGVMWKGLRWRQRRLFLLITFVAIGLVVFVGCDDWLTSSFDEKIHEQGHRLDFDMQLLDVND
ncbi:MAG: hypothetical protein CMJ19_24040 [Phycisphaeraceae bacterium]|nr:hypothetical protein [Phycisphaeraceae bacterium]